MLPPAQDLDHRRPVWDVLSDLFLDTEHSDAMRGGMARILAESPYSRDQLRTILHDEVYPICKDNLLSMVGNWSGFDLAWLEARILARRRPPRHWPDWMSPLWRAVRDDAEELFDRAGL